MQDLAHELGLEADRLYERMMKVGWGSADFHRINIAALDVANLEYLFTSGQERHILWPPQEWS